MSGDKMKQCIDPKNQIKGYMMTLRELEEKKVQACDILSMCQYPCSGSVPTQMDSDYDSFQRIVYFIPGREAKYVKVSE